MIPPLVELAWEDAHEKDADPGWNHDLDHTYRPLLVNQVGYLLSDEPGGIVVTSSWNPDFTGPRTAIPRGMIVSLTWLKAGKPAYKRGTN